MKRTACVDCRLIEPEPGTWVDGYCLSCRKARGHRTNKIGRPRIRLSYTGECEQCGVGISWVSSDPRKRKRFCGVKCHLAFQRGRRRKLPADSMLTELYVKQRMSTPRIAEMFGTDARTVKAALNRAGIKLRKRTNPVRCNYPGCQSRVKKIRHPNNGSLYGTLCEFHRWQHRKEMRHDYYMRRKTAQGGSLNEKETER